jgi:hypothetical protein
MVTWLSPVGVAVVHLKGFGAVEGVHRRLEVVLSSGTREAALGALVPRLIPCLLVGASGSFFGFVDYYNEAHRRFFATATALNDRTTHCRVAVFTQEELDRMGAEVRTAAGTDQRALVTLGRCGVYGVWQNPRLLLLVQRTMLKQFAIELGNLSEI